MAIAVYTQRPRKLQFLQAMNAIQMWRSGASNEVRSLSFSVEIVF